LIEQACQQTLEAARNLDATTIRPVPLPTKKREYCGLRPPHVDNDSREEFEIRSHRRLIDLENPITQTIDAFFDAARPASLCWCRSIISVINHQNIFDSGISTVTNEGIFICLLKVRNSYFSLSFINLTSEWIQSTGILISNPFVDTEPSAYWFF